MRRSVLLTLLSAVAVVPLQHASAETTDVLGVPGRACTVGPCAAPSAAAAKEPKLLLAAGGLQEYDPDEGSGGGDSGGDDGGDSGGGGDAFFDFNVCNKSRIKASVAVTYLYKPGSSDYVVSGWYTVNAGECTKIGRYPKGHFYHYAKAYSGTSYWGKNDLKLCVETPGPFKRINFKGYTCDAELLKPFQHAVVKTDTYKWTLNP